MKENLAFSLVAAPGGVNAGNPSPNPWSAFETNGLPVTFWPATKTLFPSESHFAEDSASEILSGSRCITVGIGGAVPGFPDGSKRRGEKVSDKRGPGSLGDDERGEFGWRLLCRRRFPSQRRFSRVPAVFLPAFFAGHLLWAQTDAVNLASPPPSAPPPVIKHVNSKTGPCRVVPKSESAGKSMTAMGARFLALVANWPPAEATVPEPETQETTTHAGARPEFPPCPPPPLVNFYQRFINGPEVKPLTPAEKAHLAARNVLDPFNAITILGNAGITIGANPRTPYGPGMPGFGRLVGISYTEDMTNEFFGTFVIPSIVHQDPHYHRMPGATIPRRILHAIVQVGWTQGDNGKGMPNYASILGAPIDAEIANLYVPGQSTNVPATAARVATGWALAPTDNFISEFLPDLARHIHVQVIFVQQIINQVAKTEPPGT